VVHKAALCQVHVATYRRNLATATAWPRALWTIKSTSRVEYEGS
jgi:hypothetical protein